MWITSLTSNALTPNAIALGNFDGIHLGHTQVIQPLLNYPQGRSVQKTVVTFNPHPQEFFSGQSKQLLTPIGEKAQALAQFGIEQLILLPFDRGLSTLSPPQFIKDILVDQLQAKFITVGEDFRFGHHRIGTAGQLKTLASQFGIEVEITPLKTDSDQFRISSSGIRQALEEGEIAQVKRLLGRTYSLTGTVVEGQRIGRTIGFPTANLQLHPLKFIPRDGVYSVQVYLHLSPVPILAPDWDQKALAGISAPPPPNLSQPIKGVMNIGHRPTVQGKKRTLEVHLLHWKGDLYGQTLTVSIEKFIRPEQKFTSLETLKAQIQRDCEMA